MQNKIELYLLGLALVIINTLLLNTFPYKTILVFILNIIFFSLIYLNIRRKRDQRSVIKQAEEILDGNLNKRIYLKNNSHAADFALILNELSEKLQKQKIKNLESEKTRKRFLSNISHDIRTPLTSLLGYVEVLNENKEISDKEKQKYYEILIKKAKNLKNMIDDIFQMARIESNDYDYDFKEIDLAEILRQTILDYLPDIKKEDWEVDIDIPEKECKIYGDKFSVERIIGNIIKNNLEHGQVGAYIGIKLESNQDGYNIFITDKGPGIKKEEIPLIFERKYEGKDAGKYSSLNSGFGLAIADKLIQLHNGFIDVTSKPNSKTVFKMFFPAVN